MIYEELPLFEGIKPTGTAAKLTGAIDRRTRPYHIGDEVVLVVECIVTGVDHSETKGGVARVHKLAVRDAYELGGDRAPDLVSTLAEEYAAALEEAGVTDPSLPFDDAEGHLVEYDADEHGDQEPGDCYLLDGEPVRWDEIEPEEGVSDGDPVFGWVALDAYAGEFGHDERERIRQYRDASSPPELVEAILVTEQSVEAAAEWIRNSQPAGVEDPTVDLDDASTVISWPKGDDGQSSVALGEYLVLEGGDFTPYGAETFVDLFPTLVSEQTEDVEEQAGDDAES